MKILAFGAALSAAMVCAPAQAQYQTVWSTTFETSTHEQIGPFPATTWALGLEGAALRSAGTTPGAGSQFLENSTTGNTHFYVAGLGAHDSLKLSFDLIFIDSWDSLNGSPAPDLLTMSIGGTVYELTAANASGSINNFGPGTLVTKGNFVGGSWDDAVVRYDLTIPHTASTFLFRLQAGGSGWQGAGDESWAIDNFSLSAGTTGAVPEPASWAMMIAGFGLVGGLTRRRTRSLAVAG